MVKKIALVLATSIALMAGSLTLDSKKSEVYYEAKKDQFFSTYTIMGINRGLKGSLEKSQEVYTGELSIDVLSFDSDDERRDTNVEEYLHSDTYKIMTYKYTLQDNKASGVMSINGVSKNLTFPVIIKEENSLVYVEGNITIKYTDFNIETPSNFILSAHENLIIGAKLYFNK